MIENEQEMAQLTPEPPPEQSVAKITEIIEEGIVLDFGEKAYVCNRAIKFAVGDRVKVIKDSGTYIVAFPLGAPITELHADSATYAETAGSAETAETAKTAASATSANTAASADNAETADHADVAARVQAPNETAAIEFRVLSNELYFRIYGYANWIKLQKAT